MNFQNTIKILKVVLSVGDESGIGPEIILKALCSSQIPKNIEIVKQNPNSALVTGPICKKSWALAGHYFSGQTEVLAKSCGAKNVGMLFTAKSPITGWRFNTLLATTHIALCEVPKRLIQN